MKKIVRSIAVVALMLTTATGMAKEPKLSLTANAKKSINFHLDADSSETKVFIADVQGNIIFIEDIQGVGTYTKTFDLGNLPSGNYFLIVDNSLKKISYTIAVDASDIEILDRNENVKPVFRKDGDRVFLNLLNLEKGNVKIKVYDSNDRVLFQEIVTNKMLVEKVFNFEKAYKDNYTVVIEDNKNTYYETVVVK